MDAHQSAQETAYKEHRKLQTLTSHDAGDEAVDDDEAAASAAADTDAALDEDAAAVAVLGRERRAASWAARAQAPHTARTACVDMPTIAFRRHASRNADLSCSQPPVFQSGVGPSCNCHSNTSIRVQRTRIDLTAGRPLRKRGRVLSVSAT